MNKLLEDMDMPLINFLYAKLYVLWTFLAAPEEILQNYLQQDPWNALFFCCVIIFLETGIIFFPFLPGDILLLLLGSLLAKQYVPISIHSAVGLFTFAAFLGAAVNYWIGRIIGAQALPHLKNFEIFNKNFKKAEDFYKHHGGKAVVISRAVGWARTFIPFLSGVCKMDVVIYTLYNLLGAILWIATFMYLGYFSPEWFANFAGHWIPIGFVLPIFVYFFVK